jgi:hypothetical protein
LVNARRIGDLDVGSSSFKINATMLDSLSAHFANEHESTVSGRKFRKLASAHCWRVLFVKITRRQFNSFDNTVVTDASPAPSFCVVNLFFNISLANLDSRG